MSALAAAAGLIFDLDGTLVDNTHAHLAAWQRVMARRGIPEQSPEELSRRIAGRVNLEFIQEVIAPGMSLEEARIMGDEKELEYRTLYAPEEVAGATAFIAAARRGGLKLAVASSAARANVDHCLGALELLDAFDVILCEGAVARGKPEPDIFLEAARQLGLTPTACVVFEDARSGIAAARAASMPVVALATTLPRADLEGEPGVILVLGNFVDAATLLLPAKAASG